MIKDWVVSCISSFNINLSILDDHLAQAYFYCKKIFFYETDSLKRSYESEPSLQHQQIIIFDISSLWSLNLPLPVLPMKVWIGFEKLEFVINEGWTRSYVCLRVGWTTICNSMISIAESKLRRHPNVDVVLVTHLEKRETRGIMMVIDKVTKERE